MRLVETRLADSARVRSQTSALAWCSPSSLGFIEEWADLNQALGDGGGSGLTTRLHGERMSCGLGLHLRCKFKEKFWSRRERHAMVIPEQAIEPKRKRA